MSDKLDPVRDALTAMASCEDDHDSDSDDSCEAIDWRRECWRVTMRLYNVYMLRGRGNPVCDWAAEILSEPHIKAFLKGEGDMG